MVTEMYSLPAYDNVDPNPLMAPFFILFYGVMMADMGYGILMILAGILITRAYRPKGTAGNLFNLMTLCGITTFVMGAVTGGFFGDFLTQLVKLATGRDFALPALFTPLDDTLMILVGAMCLGFVQIVVGMAISFVQKLKKGQVLDAILEEVTWWVVFAGIALMVLKVTNLVLYAGLVLVVAGPLITGKGFGKVTGIFASLYNHVTGYFGDVFVLLPSDGSDAGRQCHCAGVQYPGRHPRKHRGVLHHLHGGQRAELCPEPAGLLCPRPGACSAWSISTNFMRTAESPSAPWT